MKKEYATAIASTAMSDDTIAVAARRMKRPRETISDNATSITTHIYDDDDDGDEGEDYFSGTMKRITTPTAAGETARARATTTTRANATARATSVYVSL